MRNRIKKYYPALTADARQEKVIFLLIQAGITGINALTGFMILRGLVKTEYAVFTIIFSMLAIFTNITNVGITPAMSGIGGSIWENRREMQALLNTALRLRSQLGWWFAIPFIVYSAWQFGETGLNPAPLLALVLLLLFAAWIQLQFALFSIILQLNKAVRQLQENELRYVLLKFAGVATLLWLRLPVTVVFGWICLTMFLNLRVNQILAGHYLEPHAETEVRFQKAINGIIRSNFLRTLYWSLEGQISILLCTLFATTENIAEIGALGRLSVYFAIFQAFIINYSLPGLAKTQDKRAILDRAQRILFHTILMIIPILAWALLHPDSLLWVLGPNYQSLKNQLFLYLMAIAIGQLAAVVYQICAAKAWIQTNRFYVPLALPLQIGLIYWLNLADIGNVILFIGFNNLFFLLFNSAMLLFAFYRYQSSLLST